MLALLDDLDRVDKLDFANYDVSPEPAMPDVIGGSERPALARFALLVAAGFAHILALMILIILVLR